MLPPLPEPSRGARAGVRGEFEATSRTDPWPADRGSERKVLLPG